MSERGSFVTSYIYCEKCFELARAAFCGRDKFWTGAVIPSWQDGLELPIIAGKVGELSSGGEVEHARERIEQHGLEDAICHPITLAVICESGLCEFIEIIPKKGVDR